MFAVPKMLSRWKVWNGLLDYPVYSPPFRDPDPYFTREQAEANYDYFLREKQVRIRYLANYLAARKVSLAATPEGLAALDRWLYRYGGHLVPSGGEVFSALALYEPAWIKRYHGLNIINDLAIFAGDYIISKNKNIRWDLYYGNKSRRAYEEEGFCQPCLFGLEHSEYMDHLSILREVFRCCNAGFYRLKRRTSAKYKWDTPGDFVRQINYLADPNPSEPIPFSHLSIDN